MPSLEQVQHDIAAQISALPPDIQQVVIMVAAMSYKAGHEAAQREIQEASKSLISGRIN